MLAVAVAVLQEQKSGPTAQLSEASYHGTHYFLHSFLRDPLETRGKPLSPLMSVGELLHPLQAIRKAWEIAQQIQTDHQGTTPVYVKIITDSHLSQEAVLGDSGEL